MEIHCLMRKSNRLATAASILLWSALASFALRAAPATNLILMISDGCGLNSRAAAAFYMGSTNPAMACAALPVHCAVSTHPLSTGATPGSPANGAYDPAAAWKSDFSGLMKNCTDSAAAATAMASGKKTYNRAINWGNDNAAITNLISLRAKSLGKSVGIVTSVAWSHATPAAFAAHNPSRSAIAALANEMLTNGIASVIMGAGHPLFDNAGKPAAKPDYACVGGISTWTQLAAGNFHGWTLLQTRAEFEALRQGPTPPRLLGTAQVRDTLQQSRPGTSAGETPFSVPLLETVPSLETMTRAAINALSANTNGFFLMVEGGAIDKACHGRQPARMIEEIADFDKAVQAVIEWADRANAWDGTLLVVTSDHETGVVWGPDSGLGKPNPFGPIVNNGAGKMPGLRFLSDAHSNTLVPLYARGPMSHRFMELATRTDPVFGPYVDNTDIHRVMTEALAPTPP